VDLYTQQGKCERIKNFPYPKQYGTLNLMFTRLFINLVPFGMLNEFAKMGEGFVWLTIPFSALVAWVFNMMERIGEASENPFEGGANDVPITAITRTIEIDLREMLGERDVPQATEAGEQHPDVNERGASRPLSWIKKNVGIACVLFVRLTPPPPRTGCCAPRRGGRPPRPRTCRWS
jgi:hypothetical protein